MSDTRLQKAISRLNGKQSNGVILTLNQADKQVKKALIELARHKDTIDGVDFMFNTYFGL
jgi:hypothetical protein